MVKKQASIAKITPPSPKGVLCRKRLFRLLDRYRDQPIIWITGPPGSGKTTLVSSYLDARNLPCLWYQLDEGDSDLATFFYYMGLAAKKAAPRRRRPLPLLTMEYLQGIAAFTKKYFENLSGRLKIPSVVVFDNYQEVPEGSKFHEMIAEGLTSIPEGISVILISRSKPPPALSRLRANNAIHLLDWNEIRFTLKETKEIIRLRGYKRFSGKALEELHKMVQGWAAGLILTLERAKTESIEPQLLRKHIQEEIFHYFAGEIFKKMDSETQAFLLKTAFLPRMTSKMAEEISDLSHAGEILKRLSLSHYFTDRYSGAESAYQYHPLFREFLLSSAKRLFTENDICGIKRKAAKLLDKYGQIEHAVELFRETSDWAEISHMIHKHAPSFFSQGRFRIIGDWLESMPEEMVEQEPYLLYYKGASLLPFNPLESRTKFERAYELFKLRNDRTGIFLSWSEIVKSIFHEADDYNMDRQIILLKDILDENPLFPSAEIEACVIIGMFSALALRQPHHPEIARWEEQAFNLLQKGSDPNLCLDVGMPLAVYHLWSGNFDRATIVLNMLREKTLSRDASPLVLIAIKISEALYDWLVSASPESCLQNASNALKLAENTGIHIWDHNLFCHIIASALSSGDMEKAGEFLQKMSKTLNKGKKANTSFYYYLSARKALIKGDIALALQNQNMLFSLVNSLGSPFPIALFYHGMAEILIEKEEYDSAREHLSQALKIGREIKSALVEYMCLLTEASMSLILSKGERGKEKSGDWEKQGIESLRKAMTLGREHGFVNTFGWRPSVMSELCIKALEAGIEAEYVQSLIQKRNLVPEKPPVIENWPWRLKIFTLGRFGILKDGKPLRFSKKVQQRPLDMLKALVAFGGRDVPEEKLADALWPNAEGDLAHKSFEMTLLRLRRLLGDNVLKFQGGLLTLDERYCWLDVWAFQHIMDGIEDNNNAGKRGPGEKARIQEIMRLTESALHIYKGHFLPADALKSWSFSKREHLRAMFVQLMIRTGRDWEQSGQWKRAVECFEKGLEIDNLCEEFYQRLMICHQRLGQKAEAVKVYKLCRSMLASDLGITPSPKTEEIYSDLIKE